MLGHTVRRSDIDELALLEVPCLGQQAFVVALGRIHIGIGDDHADAGRSKDLGDDSPV